jgi:hypothetical protein
MQNNNTERKTYNSPKLIEYGDIKDLTLAVGKNGLTDGGSVRDRKNTRP